MFACLLLFLAVLVGQSSAANGSIQANSSSEPQTFLQGNSVGFNHQLYEPSGHIPSIPTSKLRKHRGVISAPLMMVALSGILAIAFMVLRCFKIVGMAENSRLRLRRLAEGGGGKEETCSVSASKLFIITATMPLELMKTVTLVFSKVNFMFCFTTVQMHYVVVSSVLVNELRL